MQHAYDTRHACNTHHAMPATHTQIRPRHLHMRTQKGHTTPPFPFANVASSASPKTAVSSISTILPFPCSSNSFLTLVRAGLFICVSCSLTPVNVPSPTIKSSAKLTHSVCFVSLLPVREHVPWLAAQTSGLHGVRVPSIGSLLGYAVYLPSRAKCTPHR
jgi:hypothetical protein